MFNPRCFSFARRRRGLTKKTLADRVGLSARSITAYEAGAQEPSPETLVQLARTLEFPVSFFSGDDVEEFTDESASFRSLSRMTAGQREAALAGGALAVRLGSWIEEKFSLPDPDIPDFHEATDPEAAAASVRMLWGLGERPISNLVHLVESRGVRVFSLVEDCKEVDAFSLWYRGTPYILLNTLKTAERSRFDTAHELGHLVLHRHGNTTGRTAEDQANAFASAFLMPRSAVIARASHGVTMRALFEGKEVWGVSTVAYAYRLHKVGLLSDWYYHQLMRKLSGMGLRSAEEGNRRRETSQILKKALDDLKLTGVTKAEIARQLDIYPSELDRLIFGLAMTGLPGGRSGEGVDKSAARSNLRLVTKD
jgi:Zn-dependent peptidase ImmA (M78 family)/DNA-binding XRE family transcriptional regulator